MGKRRGTVEQQAPDPFTGEQRKTLNASAADLKGVSPKKTRAGLRLLRQQYETCLEDVVEEPVRRESIFDSATTVDQQGAGTADTVGKVRIAMVAVRRLPRRSRLETRWVDA